MLLGDYFSLRNHSTCYRFFLTNTHYSMDQDALFWAPTSDQIALIANGEFPRTHSLISKIRSFDSIVAIDGGLAFCDQEGILPHLIMGDFDSITNSLRSRYTSIPKINTPNQDHTDLEKAVQFLLQFNPKKIHVFAALGKRIDHTLTNICLLSCYPDKLIFETDEEILMALPPFYEFQCRIGTLLSLIPFNGTVTGITTKGLKWNLEQGSLSKEFVGISNLVIEQKVTLIHETGDLILIHQRGGLKGE